MFTYAYQARDASGSNVSGLQEALNEENAINTLMTRGLMVLSIQQKSVTKSSKNMGSVSETDTVLFTRQLATMVDAGLPLVTALTALYEQCDPRKQIGLKRTIGDLSARVQSGDSFFDAIVKHPKTFNRLYVAMVKAGESGGLLAEILDRLAGFLEASARLRK
ncbi:MAG TPA: type II secretion system F family protein, partial [Chthoniobacteraceae bacterium]|nr:type II secretion system F family protein [Chthoniobacteraceae bacterium]